MGNSGSCCIKSKAGDGLWEKIQFVHPFEDQKTTWRNGKFHLDKFEVFLTYGIIFLSR